MTIIPKEKCGTCAYFDPKGVCRKTRELVNYFDQKDCYLASFDEPAKEENKEPMKVCKDCGRELPLSSFGGHARMKDGHQTICRECMGKRLKGHRTVKDKKTARKEAKAPAPSRKEEKAPFNDLASFSDTEIYGELRRRGWKGQLVRTETLGAEL